MPNAFAHAVPEALAEQRVQLDSRGARHNVVEPGVAQGQGVRRQKARTVATLGVPEGSEVSVANTGQLASASVVGA